jgi:hypothetical protein
VPGYLLLDIHEKAFVSGGFKGKPRNVYNPTVKSIGVVRPNQIKSLKKGLDVIDGTKRCNTKSIRKANCKNEDGKYYFGDYCSWTKV